MSRPPAQRARSGGRPSRARDRIGGRSPAASRRAQSALSNVPRAPATNTWNPRWSNSLPQNRQRATLVGLADGTLESLCALRHDDGVLAGRLGTIERTVA